MLHHTMYGHYTHHRHTVLNVSAFCRIAMLGKTFAQDSEDTHRIWIFPFANLVLRYERMLSARLQMRYRSGVAVAARSVWYSN